MMRLRKISKNIPIDAQTFAIIISTLSVFPLLGLISIVLDIEAWRHDMIRYFPDYTWKLVHDGRWLNYLLFDVLRKINAHFSFILCLALFGVYIAAVAHRVTGERIGAFAITLIALQSPSLYMQLLWPITLLPAFMVLASSIYFSKHTSPVWFFAIYGILFIGTMSYFYFLLPLLYTSIYVSRESEPLIKRASNIVVKLILPWVFGFVVGYLFASFIVYLASGKWGIQIEAWRGPNPVKNLDSLSDNLEKISLFIKRDLHFILDTMGVVLAIVLIALFLYTWWNRRDRIDYLIVPVAVFLAIYATTIPIGINIDTRSVVSVWVGLVFAFLVVPNISGKEMVVYSAIVLLLVLRIYKINHDNLTWYMGVTKTYKEETLKVIEHSPSMYKGIVMLSGKKEFEQAVNNINEELQIKPNYGIKTLSSPSRWRPTALELGFSQVIVCARGKNKDLCDEMAEFMESAESSKSNGLFNAAMAESRWLVIMVNPEYINNG